MSSNSMVLIEKLVGRANYNTWRFAVQTYLQHEELWCCIENEGKAVDPKLDLKAKSKIILLVDSVNYIHIQEAQTAKEVWTNLQKAFDDKGLTRRVGLLKDLITTTLDNCQDIEDYVNKIMTTAHKLRNISFEVNDEWLGTLLLAGLPEVYKPMIMAIESSAVSITADAVKTKLLQEIKSSESVALYAGNKNKQRTQANTQKVTKGPRCYKCNKHGHISKYCKTKRKDQTKKDENENGYVAVFSASTSNNKNNWFIDSGASMHLTMRKDWLYDLSPAPVTSIRIANDKMLEVKGCGKVNMSITDKNGKTQNIQITNVLYVPELASNLLSVSQLIKKGHSVQFHDNGCKILNNSKEEILSCKLMNNMYCLNASTVTAYVSSSDESDSYLWHQRMSHLNLSDLRKLPNCVEGVNINKNKSNMVCEYCQEGKQSRLPFPKEGSRAKKPLELVHSDVCGPLEVKSIGGAQYFLTFVDDFTRKVYVYFLKSKSEVFSKFKMFKVLVENQLDLKIKRLRTDNGTEYLSNQFKEYMQNSGIIHETSNSYTPQQNGLAERMNRTLMERARCMLINANFQKVYWAEAVATAAYITNRCPTRSISYVTPEELWSGKKPNLKHVRIFGCEVMVHVPNIKRQKLDSKASKMFFVGYSETTKGYRLLDTKTKKIIISRDVVFLENSIMRKFTTVSLTDKDLTNNLTDPNTCSESSGSQNPKEPCESNESSYNESSDDESFYSDDDSLYVPKREVKLDKISNINTRSSNRKNKHETNTYLCQGGDQHVEELPKTYQEAMSSVEKQKWEKSIQEELKAHERNETWELVKKPDKVKIIGCKWVFRIKDENNGPLYKSRLCAMGCSQKYQVDYTETFSPTVRYDSLRVMLSKVCQYNLKMIQFDIKTAFLYGNINEDIYMTPPEGLCIQENLVCKLKKSLYGLKQAPRCWNQKFDSVLKRFGFTNSHSDKCVYTGELDEIKVYLILYVDDGLIISQEQYILDKVINDLKENFEIKTCEPRNFVGLEIKRGKDYIFLHQAKYIEKIICKFNMSNANGNSIPVDVNTKLEKNKAELNKKIPYREAVGSLMHLAIVSRPDIMYGVSLVSRYLDSYDDSHWKAVKRIIKYLKETKDHGLYFTHKQPNIVESYSDADYANDTETRRSMTGYVFIKNGAAITWASQRQQSIALSTTEAEFMAACSATKEAIWLKQLLLDIDEYNQLSLSLNIDNQSAISVIKNENYHKRCKHIDIKYKFVKEKYEEKLIDLKYINTNEQCADILTKPLCKTKFQYLRTKLGICKL